MRKFKEADKKDCNYAERKESAWSPKESGWRVSTGKPAARKSSYGTPFKKK